MVVGSGTSTELMAADAKLDPKRDTIAPGATGSVRKLAPPTTPLGLITGGWASNSILMKKPSEDPARVRCKGLDETGKSLDSVVPPTNARPEESEATVVAASSPDPPTYVP